MRVNAGRGLFVRTEPSNDRDHVVIRGTRVDIDALVDSAVVRAAGSLRAEFEANAPFPHIVIDGLFSPVLLELICDEFGRVPWNDWKRYNSADEVKKGSARDARLGPASQLYFNTIHSRPFVEFIQALTGISGLWPDPGLHGGGLHEIPDGGHFRVHIDFNRHPVTGLDNRLVLITYLNKDWRPDYGGALELWSPEAAEKVSEVVPVFGRTIVFARSPRTLHGHPVPTRAPDRRPRRSVAAYFYSNAETETTVEYRTTNFIAGPPILPESPLVRGLKYLAPPILFDAARRVAARIAPRRRT